MISSNLPYHLRLNKNIERHLLVDLLTNVSTYGKISDFSYIGFGGPFLEDMKLLHNHFNISRMYSIDKSEQVVHRQNFNKPVSCIRCIKTTSEDLINKFPLIDNDVPEEIETIDEKVLVWLDYTSPSDLGAQLLEFNEIVKKVIHGSIVKITVNAHHNSLLSKTNLCPLPDGTHERPLEQEERLKHERCQILTDRLSTFIRKDLTVPENMTKNGFPKILYHTLLTAASKALAGESRIFFPLTAFRYTDGQQMLTVSGIILDKNEENNFKSITSIEDWEFYIGGKEKPFTIDAPYLSVAEKLQIDQFLPSSAEELIDNISFQLDDNLQKSNKALENYQQYYRFYPNFSKVWV